MWLFLRNDLFLCNFNLRSKYSVTVVLNLWSVPLFQFYSNNKNIISPSMSLKITKSRNCTLQSLVKFQAIHDKRRSKQIPQKVQHEDSCGFYQGCCCTLLESVVLSACKYICHVSHYFKLTFRFNKVLELKMFLFHGWWFIICKILGVFRFFLVVDLPRINLLSHLPYFFFSFIVFYFY